MAGELQPKDRHGGDGLCRNGLNKNEEHLRRYVDHLFSSMNLKNLQMGCSHTLLKSLYIELSSFAEFVTIAIEAAAYACGGCLIIDDVPEPLSVIQMINQFDPKLEDYNPPSMERFVEQIDHYIYWNFGNIMDCGQYLLRNLMKETGENLQRMECCSNMLASIATTKLHDVELKYLVQKSSTDECSQGLESIANAMLMILKGLEDGFSTIREDVWPGYSRQAQELPEAFHAAMLSFNRSNLEAALKSAIWKKFCVVIGPYWKKRQAFRLKLSDYSRIIQVDIVRLRNVV